MNWSHIGPKIPVPVWRSQMFRAHSLDDTAKGIRWDPIRSPADWEGLDARDLEPGQRVLLLIHGTGLRTRAGFLGLSPEDFERLYERYGDRIIAFQHRALGRYLDENVRQLCAWFKRGGIPMRLDVLGLSRGGLLARYIGEGWAEGLPGAELAEVHKVIFVGTPNGGTPSARRDPTLKGSRSMKAWRVDVRRMALVNQTGREVELLDDPFAIDPYIAEDTRFALWPGIRGSQDQLPTSAVLRRLNGFAGAAPGRLQSTLRYFGIASVFTWGHGAPEKRLFRGEHGTRKAVTDWALPMTNDLVVPTSSVYAPHQGPDACGLFPLARERLIVLAPSANVTHVGLMRVDRVRSQILDWLRAVSPDVSPVTEPRS